MKWPSALPVVLLIALWLAGCSGSAWVGNYVAGVEPVSATPSPMMERLKQQMVSEPETLDLRGDGTFETRRGTRIVWEGTWRTEGKSLVLRATRVMGNSVTGPLQKDVLFTLGEGGTIIDDRSKGDGYRRVYRRS